MIDFKDSNLQKNFIKHIITAYNEYNNKENIVELTNFNSILEDLKKIIDSGNEPFIYESIENFCPDRGDLKIFINNLLDSVTTYDFSSTNNQLINYKLFFIPISSVVKENVKYYDDFSEKSLLLREYLEKNYLINKDSSVKIFPRTLGVSELPLNVTSRRQFFNGMKQLNQSLLPSFVSNYTKKENGISAFSSCIAFLLIEKTNENHDGSILLENNFTSIENISSEIEKSSLNYLNIFSKSLLNELIVRYKSKIFTGISYPLSSWDNNIDQCLILQNSLNLKIITDKLKRNYKEFPDFIYIDINDKKSENNEYFFNIQGSIHGKDLFELDWLYNGIYNRESSLKYLIKNLINHKYDSESIKISYSKPDDFNRSTTLTVEEFLSGNF